MPVKREGKLDNIEPKLENALKRGLIEAGKIVAQRATNKAPRDTGRLKRSVTQGTPQKINRLRFKIDVGTNVEYAAIQEFGGTIQIPEIRPVNKKALAFNWPGAPAHLVSKSGKVVLKKVKAHPVTVPAHPYLRPALEESKAVIRILIVKNMIKALTT